MSHIEKSMLFLAVFLIICGVSKAAVYNVGDSSGWTSIGHVDYKSWAASKHFHVGDTIVFKYKKEFHNVVRVTHKNFHLCNATASYETWTSGNDSFTIPRTGHYYFICSFPEHCEGGQRVDIRVPHTPSPKAAPSPSPITNPPNAASPNSSPTTTPSPKASAPHAAPKSSPTTTPSPKASSPHVAPKPSPTTPTHAPMASSPHVAPKPSPTTPTHAPKASSPHVAPKSSPTTPAHAPMASSPHVSPKPSPIATPPSPKASSSPDTAPESSMTPADEPLPHSPAPSPTSGATPSLTSKHLFFVATLIFIFCF